MLVSGGFDPLHVGHIEYIEKAAEFGRVVVALNSDEWLVRKKGYVFMPWDERAKILRSNRHVIAVGTVDDSDDTVCDAILRLRPDYFGNGGDRTSGNTPEEKLCRELGVMTVYGLGGKVQSSSALISKPKRVMRSWGHYDVLYDSENLKVKILTVSPGKGTSVQSHKLRSEHWISGERYQYVPAGVVHRVTNSSGEEKTLVEIQSGVCLEDDIARY